MDPHRRAVATKTYQAMILRPSHLTGMGSIFIEGPVVRAARSQYLFTASTAPDTKLGVIRLITLVICFFMPINNHLWI